jgi:hypothetical protein
MKKILLLMAFMILFTTMPIAQDHVSKPPWIIDENMYIKGMVMVDSNLVPSRTCHWYLGVDSLQWNAYMCTLWCNVGMFDQLGFNCADTGKIDTSFFKDIWVDTVHSCSGVLVIDNDTTFFDGNGNDAKILQFCELLDVANTENAFLCSTLTDAGSNANIRRAFKAILVDGGFTGNNQTYAGYFYNSAGGTGAVARNYGALGYAVYASATGNYGLKGVSENAAVNVGVYGQSIDDVASADNFGLLGIASNDGASGYHCAGYFDLGAGTLPNLTFSSTIIGDNHNYTDNHLTLMDDLYNVFVVADGGDSSVIVYAMSQTDTTTIIGSSVTSDTAHLEYLSVINDTFSRAAHILINDPPAGKVYGLDVVVDYSDTISSRECTGISTIAKSYSPGILIGIYAKGEADGIYTCSTLVIGGSFSTSVCGGEHIGVLTQASSNSASDSACYGTKSSGLNAGIGNTYGGHFIGQGSGRGDHYGIYSKAISGSRNYAGFFISTSYDTSFAQRGIVCSLTTAGSDANASQHGIQVKVLPGYTGVNNATGITVSNTVVGGASGENRGIYASCTGTSARNNYGVWGLSSGATPISIGVKGVAVIGKANSDNIGVLGLADTSGGVSGAEYAGGYFASRVTSPDSIKHANQAVVISDNSNLSGCIYRGLDNEFCVFEVCDGGDSSGILRIMDASDTTILRPTSVASDSFIGGVVLPSKIVVGTGGADSVLVTTKTVTCDSMTNNLTGTRFPMSKVCISTYSCQFDPTKTRDTTVVSGINAATFCWSSIQDNGVGGPTITAITAPIWLYATIDTIIATRAVADTNIFLDYQLFILGL